MGTIVQLEGRTVRGTQRWYRERGDGCYIDCCMGVTILVVVCFLLGLVILLAVALLPPKKCSCDGAVGSGSGTNGSVVRQPGQINQTTPVEWRECLILAKTQTDCIGLCPTQFKSPSVTPPGSATPSNSTTSKTTTAPKTTASTTRSKNRPAPDPLLGLQGPRLARTLEPSHYNLELHPHIYPGDLPSFDGSVEIFMTCERSTYVIVLHVTNLTIDHSSVSLRSLSNNQSQIPWRKIELNETQELLVIHLSQALQVGSEYLLGMTFSGSLLQNRTGLYRAAYTLNNRTMYLALTQFGETHARRAFPCFDEPSFKATFNVTLVRRSDYAALSNMPLRETRNRANGWVADSFLQTPPMSTYLVAVTVCQYNYKETYTPAPNRVRIRIWAQPDHVAYVTFALSLTGSLLEAFESYFGRKYPLQKLDQVVVSDFSGAMANWGLIFYQDSSLLINPKYASTMEKNQIVATTISEQLAHQWFGNLVTMEWWDDLFFTEACTIYLGELVGLKDTKPTWKMEQVFFVETEQAMVGESRGVVGKPTRFNDSNWMAFRRGAAVLRMLTYVLGGSTFRRAVQNYLQAHAYTTATRQDFYTAVEDQARADGVISWEADHSLSSLLDPWFKQTTYPVLTVAVSTNGTLTVTQATNPEAHTLDNSSSGFRWDIPFTHTDKMYLSRYGINPKLDWIYREKSVRIADPGQSGWTLANVFRQGYYRVAYDMDTWDKLMEQLKTNYKLIPVENRAEIIADAFALVGLDQADVTQALETTRYLGNETEYAPWNTFLTGPLPLIEKLFARTTAYAPLNRYLLSLVLPRYNKLGWDNSYPDENVEKLLRTLIVEQACRRNHQPCVDQALTLFRQFRSNPSNNPISPDLRTLVYCTAMAHGGQDEFDFLMGLLAGDFRTSGDFLGLELSRVIVGLSCVREPWLITQYIEAMLMKGTSAFLGYLASQPAAQDTVWSYLDKYWHRTGLTSPEKAALLDILVDTFATNEDLQLLKEFLRDHSGLSAEANKSLLDKVDRNLNWTTTVGRPVEIWLRATNAQTARDDRRVRRSVVADAVGPLTDAPSVGHRTLPGTTVRRWEKSLNYDLTAENRLT